MAADDYKQWLDIDFRTQPQYVRGDLGVGPETFCSTYEDNVAVLSDADVKAAVQAEEVTGGADKLVSRIYNQNQEGSCFPAGTLITMSTGEVRPIEEIKCLDKVFTAEGNVGEVRQTMVRPFTGLLVGVKLHGHNLLKCTPEHPFLTKRGYVAAENLTAEDFVAVTKTRPAVVGAIQTAEYLPVRTRCRNDLRVREFNAPQGRTLTQRQIAPVPDFLALDAELGRIVGLFLAEGNVDQQKIVWTFSINEKDTIAAELASLLKSRLGIEASVREMGSRSTVKVTAYGTLWARLFEGMCSTGSGAKALCPELSSGPEDFLRAVFGGWMAGDGYYGQRQNTGVTISRKLAVQMFQIANSLGMLPSLRRSEPKATGNVKSRQPRYDLGFSVDEPNGNWRRHQDEKHSWRKVRLLTRERFDGPVYNFHVHGDESYVADGIGVHNCVANACCQSHEIVQALQYGKENVVHLSAISLYKRIGRSPDSGAMVSDGLKELSSRGALPLDNEENRAKFLDKVMPNTGFYEKFPADWENTANNFTVVEHHVIRSVEGMKTALVLGHPVVVGRQGHSICYCRLMLKNGRYVVKYANSWGNWGDNGFGYDSEGQMRMSSGWAFAVRQVRRELP